MGTRTVDQIVADVADLLHDTIKNRWTQTNLESYLNRAIIALLQSRPDANVVETDLVLVEGFEQTIPVTSDRFMDIIKNVVTPEVKRPLEVDHSYMEDLSANWIGAVPNDIVEQFSHDDRNHKRFTVYPPQPVSPGTVRILTSVIPPVVTSGNDIPVSDTWYEALLNYMLFAAYSRDYDERKVEHFSLFERLIGVKTQADSTVTPNAQG